MNRGLLTLVLTILLATVTAGCSGGTNQGKEVEDTFQPCSKWEKLEDNKCILKDGVKCDGDPCTPSNKPGYECSADWVCTPDFSAKCAHDSSDATCQQHKEGWDCSSDVCREKDGWDCNAKTGVCTAEKCGDGIVAGDEKCDPGTSSLEGCDSTTCKEVPGYKCTKDNLTQQVTCQQVCGDGVKTKDEACDDGNSDDGDGCSQSCQKEAGWDCTTGGDGKSTCVEKCGNGVKTKSEACDGGAGCDNTICNAKLGYTCDSTGACTPKPQYTCDAQEKCEAKEGWDCSGGTCKAKVAYTCDETTGNCNVRPEYICSHGFCNPKPEYDCDAQGNCKLWCGNGVVDRARGETCDTKATDHSKNCTDIAQACPSDRLVGQESQCNVECLSSAPSCQKSASDNQCPAECTTKTATSSETKDRDCLYSSSCTTETDCPGFDEQRKKDAHSPLRTLHVVCADVKKDVKSSGFCSIECETDWDCGNTPSSSYCIEGKCFKKCDSSDNSSCSTLPSGYKCVKTKRSDRYTPDEVEVCRYHPKEVQIKNPGGPCDKNEECGPEGYCHIGKDSSGVNPDLYPGGYCTAIVSGPISCPAGTIEGNAFINEVESTICYKKCDTVSKCTDLRTGANKTQYNCVDAPPYTGIVSGIKVCDSI